MKRSEIELTLDSPRIIYAPNGMVEIIFNREGGINKIAKNGGLLIETPQDMSDPDGSGDRGWDVSLHIMASNRS